MKPHRFPSGPAVLLVLSACGKSSSTGETAVADAGARSPAPVASGDVADPKAPVLSPDGATSADARKELVSAGGTGPVRQAAMAGTLACRATDGKKTFELFLESAMAVECPATLRTSSGASVTAQSLRADYERGAIGLASTGGAHVALLTCDSGSCDSCGSCECPQGKKQLAFMGGGKSLTCASPPATKKPAQPPPHAAGHPYQAPTAGAPCSVGELQCAGDRYVAECVKGRWHLTDCSPNTCFTGPTGAEPSCAGPPGGG